MTVLRAHCVAPYTSATSFALSREYVTGTGRTARTCLPPNDNHEHPFYIHCVAMNKHHLPKWKDVTERRTGNLAQPNVRHGGQGLAVDYKAP